MPKMRGGAGISRKLKILLPTAAAIVVLDQATKAVLSRYLYEGQILEVIPGFFSLVYFKNPGAAFGIFTDGGITRTLFLVAVAVVALFAIGLLLKQSRDPGASFALSMIAGGAIGNLIDRIRFGSVVDFLDFHLGRFHWPAFNVADSAITVGVALTIWFFYFKPGKTRH